MQSRQLRRAAERQALKQARKPQTTPVPEVSTSRAEINRENSQHSSGPRTPEGKSASSRNSFKHGLYSKALIYPGENPAELDALKADLRAQHQPVNTTEEILVNEMAEQFWRIRRWREREAGLMSYTDPKIGVVALTEMMPIFQRLMSAAERGFHKSLSSLRQLQKDRGFVPHFSGNAAAAEETASAETDKQPEEIDREPGHIIEIHRDNPQPLNTAVAETAKLQWQAHRARLIQEVTGRPAAAAV